MAYASNEDPEQNSPSDQGLHGFHSTKYFKKQLHKSKNFAKNLFEMFGHLLYSIFNIRTTPLIRPLLDSPKSGLNSGTLLYSRT